MNAQTMNQPSSQLAIASLVLGLLSWVMLPVLGGIGAVVCGHLARRDIRAARGALGGDGMAVAGLVLGYLHLVLLIVGVIVAILLFGSVFALLAAFAH
ncbi:DUF4190 domain-containing protein [Lysobacter claricitrinus]|uniref:DUF4190 domain-containing protein n=1 Tax=Lysobacter claricitrinus TaxID=3367728 RepID=UPI0037DB2CE7